MAENKRDMNRRQFLKTGAGGACLAGLGGLVLLASAKKSKSHTVWQLDPHVCVSCGNCETHCVLELSAVKCVHAFAMCGYCNLCTGFLRPDPITLDSGSENEPCPTGAIKRTFIEDPYYEYTIDEDLCIGCAKCVKGCNAFGNGSLFLQVRHDRCLNCNECSIAAACPSGAYKRVPIESPYLLKDVSHS